MKTVIIVLALLAAVATDPAHNLTGRWQTFPSEKGNVTAVVFKADGSFEGFVNRKPFTSGTYALSDSIFTVLDNGCSGVTGTYRISFFSNNDSIRFKSINDSCAGRKQGMNRLVLGRIK